MTSAPSCFGNVIATASAPMGPASEETSKATDEFGLLVATQGSVRRVSPAGYLVALCPRARMALLNTIGQLPQVRAVLWAMEGQHIRVVTAVADYCDETLEAVAERELQLMDGLPEFFFEFRVIPGERVGTFLRAGYFVVLEQRTEHTDADETRKDDDA